MQVEIWSDVVCPWCYIGKRRFEAALALFDHRDEVQVSWRAFELDPSAESEPPRPDGAGPPEGRDHAGRIAKKYGITRAEAQAMTDSMTAAAAAEGLDFHLDTAVRANTFAAHQVIHLAGEHGVQDAVKERLMQAYFTDGDAVGEHEALVGLAAQAGLDPAEVRAALEDGRYGPAVRHEQAEAAAFGINAVPFFVVDRRYGVAGAQPAEQLVAVLDQAWTEAHPFVLVGSDDATACGPDGCAI